MDRREFLTMGVGLAAAGCLSRRPSAMGATEDDVAAFEKAVAFLESTSATDYDARQEALAVAQKMIYAMKPAANPYREMVTRGLSLSDDEVGRLHAEFPALAWYDRAFDRVCEAVKATTVAPGAAPAVWYVYNMGIVVKTAQVTFAVDLCHRKAVELVPFLDFALVTHNHGDHFTEAFLVAMAKAEKPIISNFRLCWKWYCREFEKTFVIKDVTIRCTAADHNKFLPNAVTCFELDVDRGEGREPYVICHSGDCHRADHLRTSVAHPDLYFGHCAIGLSFPDAYRTTMPAKTMVIAHHQELGHLWGIWRCVGFHEEPAKIMKELRGLGANVVMPVWGDRLV